MSNFPNNFDDDTTLPFVNDNITEVGDEAINALRDSVMSIQQYLGLGGDGSTGSISARLGVSLLPDGYIRPSAITGLGLVTLPITQDQIATNANIPESKLLLDHKTQDLFNYTRDLANDINLGIGWISTTGVKLDPHLMGAIYRHTMGQIDVSSDEDDYLQNNKRTLRDNLSSYTLVSDMNSELLAHQWADGSPFGTIVDITTNNGSVYPNNYGHTASGIFLNTSRFTTVPQTAQDLQLFAEYIDSTSIFLLGSRIQNLYSNGISRVSRSVSLTADGYAYGQPIIPSTPAIAYLKNIGNNSGPFDSIDTGDDIVELKPSDDDLANNSFDAKFALVKVGDIIRVDYGNIEIPFVIKEKKYYQNGSERTFLVRIAGKNHAYAPLAVARIDKPLFNNNKAGVIAVAAANNNFSEVPSLIVASPRGGEALGLGFCPDELNEDHYLLYLALYPTGNPADGYTILPAIDVTGNQGVTPGLYTLDSVVEATNNAFRQNGYNYRFIAFTYGGEFGIMLADSYGNASFSILSAVVTDEGAFDPDGTEFSFPKNVIDLFPDVGTKASDPLGFGPTRANLASPPYMTSYGSAEAAQYPTKLFVPLRKNNFYVDGIEKERMTLEVGQALDVYGDGYWVSQIIDVQVPAGRVQTTYRIPLDLSTSQLKAGKTVVIQSLGQGSLVDFGRYTIQSVSFGCSPANYTDVTVYDSVHAIGFSPAETLATDGYVALYFNSDSVSFNSETATDFNNVTPFKRHFEVYTDKDSFTFTHERGRFLAVGEFVDVNSPMGATLYSFTELAKMDIVKISPKLRGYQYGTVTKITLHMNSYNSTSGVYDGYLAAYDGNNLTKLGPTITGRKGVVTRFYDETQVDFIDIIFDLNVSVSSFSNELIDIQLFPTLSFDDEVMLIANCQYNDATKVVTKVRDQRQFGNTSEKDLTTSALNFISLPEKLLHFNGAVRGFDIPDVEEEYITINGGTILVGGKLLHVNDKIISIPKVMETYDGDLTPINWALCINEGGELVTVPLLDADENTPDDLNRIINLFNVVSLTTYEVDCSTFSNILNNRKDLTVLYVVTSNVTGSGPSATVTLTVRDVRRFVNDQDSSIDAVVTTNNSQGNFKTFGAAANWLRFNSSFQNTIQVKGINVTSADPYFDGDAGNGYGNTINVVGKSKNASLSFTDIDASFENVRFKDLVLEFGNDATFNNVEFDNCKITVTRDLAGVMVMSNCSLTVGRFAGMSETSVFSKCSLEFASSLNIGSSTLTDCDISVGGGGTMFDARIRSSTISLSGTNPIAAMNTTIERCSIVATSMDRAFTVQDNFKFENNSVSWSVGSLTDYDSSDLVNAANGFMFADVSSSLLGLRVKDNSFSSSEINRFPYVTLVGSSRSTNIEDVEISGNRFNLTISSDDVRAVIALVSTVSTDLGFEYPEFPRLNSVFIDRNTCCQNQMILLSVEKTSSAISVPPFTVTNTRITNNICGTIGFLTGGTNASSSYNQSTYITDKKDSLIISGNTCKLITNLDSIGDYIPFVSQLFPTNSVATVTIPTGPATIFSNSAHWILVGCSSWQNPANVTQTPREGVMILNNTISPANSTFLSNYTNESISVTPPNCAIVLRKEAVSSGGVSRSIISGNSIIQNTLLNPNTSALTSYYYDSAIVCFNNAQVTGNNVVGVISKTDTPLSTYSAMLYIGQHCDVIASGNYFDRKGNTIDAYVTGESSSATTNVRIVDNIFDSQYINSGNTIETVGTNIPSAWAYNRNRNQIFYKEIGLADNSVWGDGAFGGGQLSTSDPASSELFIFHDSRDSIDTSFEIKAFRAIHTNFWTEAASTHFITVSDYDDNAAHTKAWSMRGNLDVHLPENVTVLNARVGYFLENYPNANCLDHTHNYSGTTFQWNIATLTLFKYKNSTTSLNSTIGVLDVKHQVTGTGGGFGFDLSVDGMVIANHYISENADETAIRTNTQVLTADLTAYDFTSGKDYRMGWEIDQNFKKANTGVNGRQIHFHWSPIVLKCIYR